MSVLYIVVDGYFTLWSTPCISVVYEESSFPCLFFADPINMFELQHNAFMSFHKLVHSYNHYYNQNVTKSKLLLLPAGQASESGD